MDRYAVLVVGMAPEVEGRLATALGQHQGVRAVGDAPGARGALAAARPAVAAVALDGGGSADALALVRELAATEVAVVAVAAQKDPELILAALRAGAREFLLSGDGEGLEKAVQQLLETRGLLQLGHVTAILPAKGGMGATTLATNLAGALHRRGKRACLVDLDLELGDVLSFLDMRGTYSLGDVALNTRRLDRDLLDASVPRHGSGVWVLSQAEKVREADRLDAQAVGAVLRFLRPQYEHLVLDGLRGLGDVSLAALDLADRILVVVTQEVPAIRDAQRRVELLRELGYPAERLWLVVNRWQKGSSITREVIEETLGLPVAATVGNDFRSLSHAVNKGVLLWDEAPRSVVVRDLDALAERLAPASREPAEAGLLQKLLSRTVGHGAR